VVEPQSYRGYLIDVTLPDAAGWLVRVHPHLFGLAQNKINQSETLRGSSANIMSVICYSFPYADLLAKVGDDVVIPRDGDFRALHGAPLNGPLVFALLQRLWHEALRGNPGYATLQDGAILTIVSLLLGSHKGPATNPGHNPLAAWQANRAIAMMKENIGRDLPLRALAAEVRLSPFHFARTFKPTAGLPPGRFQ
jgi:hypothetical protein